MILNLEFDLQNFFISFLTRTHPSAPLSPRVTRPGVAGWPAAVAWPCRRPLAGPAWPRGDATRRPRPLSPLLSLSLGRISSSPRNPSPSRTPQLLPPPAARRDLSPPANLRLIPHARSTPSSSLLGPDPPPPPSPLAAAPRHAPLSAAAAALRRAATRHLAPPSRVAGELPCRARFLLRAQLPVLSRP
jgi:hypothetical protein